MVEVVKMSSGGEEWKTVLSHEGTQGLDCCQEETWMRRTGRERGRGGVAFHFSVEG